MASRLADGPTDLAISDALVACHSHLGDVSSSALFHFQCLVQSGGTPSTDSSAALLTPPLTRHLVKPNPSQS
uniref:Uncharacterized protein n=1 Tax=Oryza brachyantha TaxID=4533 RepID=J3NDA8_ORYBR